MSRKCSHEYGFSVLTPELVLWDIKEDLRRRKFTLIASCIENTLRMNKGKSPGHWLGIYIEDEAYKIGIIYPKDYWFRELEETSSEPLFEASNAEEAYKLAKLWLQF